MNKIFKSKTRGDYFRFGSVFIQKIQPNQKKKRPETEPKPAGFSPFQSGFLSKKPEKPICIFLALLAQRHHKKLKLLHFSRIHNNHRAIITDRLVNNKTIDKLLSL
jgi:transposase